MTKLAIRAVDIPEEAEKRSSRAGVEARKVARKGALKGKTLESLTPKQRDQLLKELAIQAGLIEDSDDD